LDAVSKQPVPWKTITTLLFWLWMLPPLGLWLLWRDQTLGRSTKIRLLSYAFLIPVLLYFAFMLYQFDQAEKAIRAAGGVF
jgi:RsiW-degrading membrane proteinase PrsW (M82 family)